jgi:hypothetical protein
MAASTDELTHGEAAKLLRWWLDAGVDVAIAEEPRNWLKAVGSSRGAIMKVSVPGSRPAPACRSITVARGASCRTGCPVQGSCC